MAIRRALNSQHLAYRSNDLQYGPLNASYTTRVDNEVGLPLAIKENPGKVDLQQAQEVAYGVPSIINPYALLTFPTMGSHMNQVIDNPFSTTKFSSPIYRQKDSNGINNLEPSVYNLVNTPPDGKPESWASSMPYRYTDFLYSKFYGVIPNHQLITLRRYPAPAWDNLGIPLFKDDKGLHNATSNFTPIAQAITYMGEEPENKLSEFMSFEVGMNWKEFEAQVEHVHGNEQSSDEGPNAFKGVANLLTAMSGSITGKPISAAEQQNAQYDPYATGPYSHRVYGPVNTISKTYKRDRGLEFKQTFNLNFHYQLKSIGNINPKAAMLDIMSNMLQLTYNNAAFWGGANRYFPNRPVYPFIGGRDGMNAWYRGDAQTFVQSMGQQIANVADSIGTFFTDLFKDPISALKQLATGGGSMLMATMGRGKAPDIVAMKALLTGEPVGEWHMIVGNPYSPTLMIGNLICKGAKFIFNDTLGADNFPTELKVTINMEHGRPRDKGDIESMFNMGEGRIYYSPMNSAGFFDSASQHNSTNDTSFKGTNMGGQVEHPSDTNKKGNISSDRKRTSGYYRGYMNQSYAPGSQDFDNIKTIILETGHMAADNMGLRSAHVKPGTVSKPTLPGTTPATKTKTTSN